MPLFPSLCICHAMFRRNHRPLEQRGPAEETPLRPNARAKRVAGAKSALSFGSRIDAGAECFLFDPSGGGPAEDKTSAGKTD
jgi:hypothetical protein